MKSSTFELGLRVRESYVLLISAIVMQLSPVGDLQATTDSLNLLQAHINKGDLQNKGVILHDDIY